MKEITQSDIPAVVQSIGIILLKSGYDAHLVGGCTRDLLLGLAPKDWDITTNADPDQIKALFPEHYHNNDFGTVGVKTVSEESALHIVEVTPYRSEGAYTDNRRPDSVTFGVSLLEDLGRRDFTVNAIALNLRTYTLYDPCDGLADLDKGCLRTVGSPNLRFEEDALRILRAVRLSCQLNFYIEVDTMNAISANNERITTIAIERVSDEFLKLLQTSNILSGIVLLQKLQLLRHIIPELEEGIGCEQGGTHSYDVFEHNVRTAQAAADKGHTLSLRLAALLHDIAKPRTRGIGKHKQYSFHGHEVLGAKMATKILARLRVPRETSETVVLLIRWHMFFADPDEITLSAVRRTIVKVGEEQMESLLKLRVCDRIGTGRPKEEPFRFRKYKAMVDQALRDPISVKKLAVDGGILIKELHMKPGPRMGMLLHALLEVVLDDPEQNTTEQLLTVAREYNKLDDQALQSKAAAGKDKRDETEAAELQAIKQSHKVS
jgi:putative nucleotidyltransferase with HDIG domain